MCFIRKLLVATAVVTNGCIYYSIKNGTGLYKYSIDTDTHELIEQFETCEGIETELYKYAFWWENKIFFVPYNAKIVAIYDLKEEKIVYDPSYNAMFSFFIDKDIKAPQIYKYRVIDDWVYIVGTWNEPFVYKMNMRSKIGYEIEAIKKLSEKWLSLRNCFWDNNRCIIPAPDENEYYELDVNTDSLTVVPIPEGLHGIHGILYTDNCKLYMGGMGGNLYEHNVDETNLNAVFRYEDDDDKEGTGYAYIDFYNGKIYLIPNPNSLYKFEIYDIFEKKLEYIEGERKNDHLYSIGEYKNGLIFYSEIYNEFITLGTDRMLKRICIVGDDKYIVPFIPNDLLVENDVWTVNEFINNIV